MSIFPDNEKVDVTGCNAYDALPPSNENKVAKSLCVKQWNASQEQRYSEALQSQREHNLNLIYSGIFVAVLVVVILAFWRRIGVAAENTVFKSAATAVRGKRAVSRYGEHLKKHIDEDLSRDK